MEDSRGRAVTRTFTVRDMPAEDRPRERLRRLGPEALTVQELLAVVMGRGVQGIPVTSLAEELVVRFGGLKGLAQASAEQMAETKGMGEAKICQLQACMELARRLRTSPPAEKRTTIKSPEDAVALLRRLLQGKAKEHFVIMPLDTRSHPIGEPRVVSVGSLNESVVHPREVFREAVSACAASVIVAHNHPSGDPEPSPEDIKLTKRLAEAGELMGIEVVDHIIVCDDCYLSLKVRKLL